MYPDDVPSVTNQDPFQWPARFALVAGADITILDDLIGSPKMTSTDSAPDVTWSLLLDPNDQVSSSVKCNECKTVTEHWVTDVVPMPEPMIQEHMAEAMKKRKRLQICTLCGTLSLRQ